MNIVTLSGRLTKDPEIKYTTTGKAVAAFTLAVDVGYGDKKKTSFISCEAWEKRAETIGNTLIKGRKIIIEGAWMQQSWEKDGQKRRKDYCRVNNFEYCESKPGQAEHTPDAANQFGDDVMPGEVPF